MSLGWDGARISGAQVAGQLVGVLLASGTMIFGLVKLSGLEKARQEAITETVRAAERIDAVYERVQSGLSVAVSELEGTTVQIDGLLRYCQTSGGQTRAMIGEVEGFVPVLTRRVEATMRARDEAAALLTRTEAEQSALTDEMTRSQLRLSQLPATPPEKVEARGLRADLEASLACLQAKRAEAARQVDRLQHEVGRAERTISHASDLHQRCLTFVADGRRAAERVERDRGLAAEANRRNAERENRIRARLDRLERYRDEVRKDIEDLRRDLKE